MSVTFPDGLLETIKRKDWIQEMHYKGPLEMCDTERWVNELDYKLLGFYSNPKTRSQTEYQNAEKYRDLYYILKNDGFNHNYLCCVLFKCSKELEALQWPKMATSKASKVPLE